MSYRMESGEHPGSAAKRIACEQAGEALAELRDPELPVALRVHLLRKRCTRIRAVAKLIRPGFGDYDPINAALRDIARLVTEHRDARIMHELVAEFADGEHFASILACYRSRCGIAEEHACRLLSGVEQSLARAVRVLERCDVWGITYEHVLGGFETTHARAAQRYARMGESATDAEFHELRKHFKYHGLQLRLLDPVLSGDVRDRQLRVDQIYTLLGDAQDCSVLLRDMTLLPEYFRGHPDFTELRAAARRLARRRRRKALAHAGELFAAASDGVVARAHADLRRLHDCRRQPGLMMAG